MQAPRMYMDEQQSSPLLHKMLEEIGEVKSLLKEKSNPSSVRSDDLEETVPSPKGGFQPPKKNSGRWIQTTPK